MSDDTPNIREMWAKADEKEIPLREALAAPGMDEITRLTHALREYGWQEAIYCPKDRSIFLGWDPLCSLPYDCYYEGEWPRGSWWACVHGDLWPARPVMWKPKP